MYLNVCKLSSSGRLGFLSNISPLIKILHSKVAVSIKTNLGSIKKIGGNLTLISRRAFKTAENVSFTWLTLAVCKISCRTARVSEQSSLEKGLSIATLVAIYSSSADVSSTAIILLPCGQLLYFFISLIEMFI